MSVYPKYDRYKDSGVDWLGDVPEHWEVESLRAAAELFVEKNRPDLPVLSVYREYGVILKDSRDDNHNATSLDTSSYKVVQPGDLAVNKMKAWQGSLGVSEHHGIVSPAYITCRLNQKKVSGRYIHYLLRSKTLVGALDSISYGVRVGQWDMRFEDFKKVGITIPPKPEQDRIVTFLDRKTAEIDALIAKKQRQIELLDEQKAILINRAVTRGLNPNAKLKPSGIEWIGEIPAHWTTERSKRVFAQRKELARPDDIQLSATQAYGVIGQDDYEKRIGRRIVKIMLHLEKRKHVELDDFVISMRSFQGGLERAWVSGCIRSSYTILRPIAEVDAGFFTHFFKSHSYIKALQSTGNFIRDGQDLNYDNFCAVDIILPPIAEQKEIGSKIQEFLGKTAEAIRGIEREINSLKTLRSTLIAHAVTGRIKV
ncbi:restriction endonuclease subunit S [Haloferula rosea]|uniref:Restriction endonuclease subunit S n=1 Tax=Haloferula rosea TaxID=490093 RepID=A0A934R7W4_9BACT|nr:restriction endonuclease subunit S [Haloferula rosea]MBK1826889.1 restriction endonuclease subunit S [Haloferula rosea]